LLKVEIKDGKYLKFDELLDAMDGLSVYVI